MRFWLLARGAAKHSATGDAVRVLRYLARPTVQALGRNGDAPIARVEIRAKAIGDGLHGAVGWRRADGEPCCRCADVGEHLRAGTEREQTGKRADEDKDAAGRGAAETGKRVFCRASIMLSRVRLVRGAPARALALRFNSSTTAPTQTDGERTIEHKLRTRFTPKDVQVQDISGASRYPLLYACADEVTGGCGSFYAISITSAAFKDLSIIQQHRLVNETLKEDIAGIHGLQARISSVRTPTKTLTPEIPAKNNTRVKYATTDRVSPGDRGGCPRVRTRPCPDRRRPVQTIKNPA